MAVAARLETARGGRSLICRVGSADSAAIRRPPGSATLRAFRVPVRPALERASRCRAAGDTRPTEDRPRRSCLGNIGRQGGGGQMTSPFQIAQVSHVAPMASPEIGDAIPRRRSSRRVMLGPITRRVSCGCRGLADEDRAIARRAGVPERPRLDGRASECDVGGGGDKSTGGGGGHFRVNGRSRVSLRLRHMVARGSGRQCGCNWTSTTTR